MHWNDVAFALRATAIEYCAVTNISAAMMKAMTFISFKGALPAAAPVPLSRAATEW